MSPRGWLVADRPPGADGGHALRWRPVGDLVVDLPGSSRPAAQRWVQVLAR
ncbi:MAG: hypothetical protein ACREI9_10755 [Nitrospiraceae bacterium]